jgi:N-formylglutamate deformylase
VPTIQKEKFPDLILGDADGLSASDPLITTALTILQSDTFSVAHNHPFKGGNITRRYGKPGFDQHALQLEMAKVNYMDDTETTYSVDRATVIRKLLQRVFGKLIDQLGR